MIIYLDTSALLKTYIQEDSSEKVVGLLNAIDGAGTSVITQAEMASAISRASRMGAFSPGDAQAAWNAFLDDWSSVTRLTVSFQLVERAATLAWEHGLRGYEAIHLASALTWQEVIETPVTLATFDRELWQAAKRAGLGPWPDELG